MGKKTYIQCDVSEQKTTRLGIDDLLVLGNEGDDCNFYAVHRRYFEKGKIVCPACGSARTRSSKFVNRTFKDIIGTEPDFRIIDLHFHQRYLRCDNCGSSVFPEPINFGGKSFRYTNRLADKLAEGTFRYSYKKVCEKYGVPASTASVGAIMRRQISLRESRLHPLKTPATLCIVETLFYGELHPIILASWDGRTYCLDILEDAAESTYIKMFKTLDAQKIESVYVEPSDSLRSAVATCFPAAVPMLTDECVLRHARNAMLAAIEAKGKRLALRHKNDRLTLHAKHLSADDGEDVIVALQSRPELKQVYDYYQQLLDLLEVDWSYNSLTEWLSALPQELAEFEDLKDIIEIYGIEIRNFSGTALRTSEEYASSVKGLCAAIEDMPHCIFDVFRARCLLTSEHSNVRSNGTVQRLGILIDKMKANMNEISTNIKERRDYGFE